MIGFLMGRGNSDIDTHIGRKPCEEEGRDGALLEAEKPKIVNKPPETRRVPWNIFSPTASEGNNPANTLTSDL